MGRDDPQRWTAKRLCDAASDFLAERYPGALIVRELSIGNWGSALLDIAAITDDEIVGIEIKGEGDSHARLERQGWIYSQVATRMGLLPAPALEASIGKRLPADWLLLRLGGGVVKYPSYAWAEEWPWRRLATAPARLLETLCGRELKAIAQGLGLHSREMTRVDQWVRALAENVPLRDLRALVCAELRGRDWLKYDAQTGRHRPERYRWADLTTPSQSASHGGLDSGERGPDHA